MSNVKEYSYAQHFQLFSHANVIMRITLFENHAILCRKHDCTHRALRFYISVTDSSFRINLLRCRLKVLSMSKKVSGKEQKPQKQGMADAENLFKEVCQIFQREAARLRQEQEAIDAMSEKLEHVHFSSTIKLNVGGHHFTTSLQTLTKDPNSMLAAMFSGKFEMKPSEDGAFFIDRDGTHFRFILNFLRNGELILPEGATFLKELEAEAKFYQIQGILDELKPKAPKYFEESVILTNEEHRGTLGGWLPQYDKWHLLFRASRDGFAAQTFHSRCDNKGPTITIVKSGNNIFGGFTENSWNSKYKKRKVMHGE